jgi:N-acyl-D-aspartate/D-glutamate deacylase
MIEEAVAMGLDVAADRYPYTGWHGGSTNIFTPWCYEEAKRRGGREHLKDLDIIDHFRQEVADLLADFGGPDKLMFTPLREPDPEIEGKTVADLMEQWDAEPIEVALEIERRNEENRIGAVGFTMSEENLRRILAHPLVMVGTDAHLEIFGRTATHPRNYGTYPRVLGKYVREEGIMSWGEAIAKMTSMPAERHGIRERGWLRPGYFADMVVFDPETVIDNATFTDAHQYPSGMPCVIVNGQVAVDDGATAPEHYGRVLRR